MSGEKAEFNGTGSETSISVGAIRHSLRHFPAKPGVYIMKDESGGTIYVGKALNLRNRVRSYFSGRKDPKTAVLVSRVAEIEHIVCRNEYEALLLENSLIKKHQPRYNINLKDGKTYPVIRVTNEEYPRVFRTRRVVNDGSTYYGPYTNVSSIDAYLELIEQLFPLRKCRGPVRKRPSPCLYYHMGRCTAVCAGKTDREEYLSNVERIRRLLGGERESLINELTGQMHEAGRRLDFERAASIRDTIQAIESLAHEQQVIDNDPDVRDFVGVARRDQMATFVVFQMRGGKLVGSDMFRTDVFAGEEEDLLQFVLQYYSQVRKPPTRLFLPIRVESGPLSAFFREQLGAEVTIETAGDAAAAADGETGPAEPVDEPHTSRAAGAPPPADISGAAGARAASIINMATENARQDLERRIRDSGNLPALEELRHALNLPGTPYRIEGFDIAHVDGKHPVAALVSFHNGIPDTSRYRSFNLRTLEGAIDDFEAMREVIARRYVRVRNERSPKPDLILIDGGKGQVSAAREILESLDMDTVPVVGLAKRNEEIFLPDRSEPVTLPKGAPPLKILQYVRDEAHRFATSRRAGKQSKDLAMTVLEGVPGLGPKRLKRLLEEFGSPAAISRRSAAELSARAGLPDRVAQAVVDTLAASSRDE